VSVDDLWKRHSPLNSIRSKPGKVVGIFSGNVMNYFELPTDEGCVSRIMELGGRFVLLVLFCLWVRGFSMSAIWFSVAVLS